MKNNNSSAVLGGNVMGHVRGESGGSAGGWKEVRMHKIDAFNEREASGEEERAVEEIRSRIRGWSVGERKDMGMGVVSEVSTEGIVVAERNSVGSEEEILDGLVRKKSTKDMGGISKTVVFDVKYERAHEIPGKGL
jgi:hypothetical protein